MVANPVAASGGVPKKAMLFAAGWGERMGPLVEERAKPALPLAGVPLIIRIFDWFRDSGIEEVAINLHYLPSSLNPILDELEDRGFVIHRSLEQEEELIGTSGGLSLALERFPALAEGPLLVLNGDTLPTLALADMVAFHRQHGGEATLLADPKPGPAFAGERRLQVNGDGVIEGLLPPPEGEDGEGLGFCGLWLLEPSALRHLTGRPGGLSQDLLPGLIADGSGRAFASEAPWFEIGTPRRYLAASLRAEALGVFPVEDLPGPPPGRAAVVERSLLLENATVREEAFVRDSIIGPGEVVPPGDRVEDALFFDGASKPLDRDFAKLRW